MSTTFEGKLKPIPSWQSKLTPLTPSPTTAGQAPKPDFLSRASNIATSIFPGTKAIGESLGTAAVNIGRIFHGKQPNIPVDIPKTIGGYVAAGGTVASLAAPIPKAATVAGTAAKAAAQTGALSAIIGGGKTASDGGTMTQTAKSAFLSGLTGAAIAGAAGAASKAIDNFANKAPEHIYDNALRVTSKLKEAGRSPSSFLKDEGVWGNLGTISKATQEGINTESNAIKAKIATTVATKGDIPTYYATVKSQAAEKLAKELGGLYSKAEIDQIIDSVPVAQLRDTTDGLGLEATDAIRSKLGMLIGDTKWLQQNPTQNTKAAQAVYRVLSDTVKSHTDTATEFARLSKWLDTRKVLTRALHLADSKYGIGLYDILSGAAGATYGGFSSDGDVGTRLRNAALGGLAGLAAERAVNSPALKTGAAQLLTKIPTLPTETAGKAGRAAITTLIGRGASSASE